MRYLKKEETKALPFDWQDELENCDIINNNHNILWLLHGYNVENSIIDKYIIEYFYQYGFTEETKNERYGILANFDDTIDIDKIYKSKDKDFNAYCVKRMNEEKQELINDLFFQYGEKLLSCEEKSFITNYVINRAYVEYDFVNIDRMDLYNKLNELKGGK